MKLSSGDHIRHGSPGSATSKLLSLASSRVTHALWVVYVAQRVCSSGVDAVVSKPEATAVVSYDSAGDELIPLCSSDRNNKLAVGSETTSAAV